MYSRISILEAHRAQAGRKRRAAWRVSGTVYWWLSPFSNRAPEPRCTLWLDYGNISPVLPDSRVFFPRKLVNCLCINNKLFWMANEKLLPGAAAWTAASLWCMVCEGLALNVMPGPKSHIHMCFVVLFTSSLRVSRSSHKFWQMTCCRCPTFSQRLATCTLFSFFSNALKWPILNPQIGDIICILALLFTWYICIFLNLYIPLYFYSVMFSLGGHLIIHHF